MGNTDLSYDITSAKEKLINATGAISSVSLNLNSAATAFAGVVEKIETRLHDLDQREAAVKEMEKMIISRTDELVKKEEEMKEREQKVDEREREVGEREEKWREMEKRMEMNAAKLEPLVHLNVGGERFTAPKTDLLRFKGSYFEAMLTTDHLQKNNGEYFINQDPKPFRHILNFLRTGQLEHLHDCYPVVLEQAFKMYKIPFPVFPFTILLATDEGGDPGVNFIWQSTIIAWLPNKGFRLLYKATRDGFAAEDFHRVCDNQGPTLTIIQSSEGYLFGGYTPLSWDSSSGFISHPDCFLFTLTNPHEIKPTKYKFSLGDSEAICCSELYCATFGGGYDILVCSNSNANNSSYTNFPRSYGDTTEKGRETFTGNVQFTSKDIEVYSVI